MKKQLPTFKNEAAEREFWATHDSKEYIDWSKAKPAVCSAALRPAVES